ncbi:VWA domain-containing protein [Curtobacterium sp. YR515]|uniref:VWA domain-containing protein n=1 Tax=Curtobacterium sp. YR515 TaxID=1855316 RepID=UPI0008F176E1|nr:VWA domain-containing protein [Curtobacterium sp. YR515]SFF33316.1 Ca-activated chloride channel family protein [Curtobacterium sp. YR515]
MTFTTPWLLLALIPVAALAIAYVLVQRRRQRYAVRFATLPMLDRLVPKRPRWRRHLPAALVLLGLGSLGVAAAQPQVDIRVPYERATVIVAIDTSGSMQADDVRPNRLEAAKSAAEQFVAEMPETFNVGAISFAGGAEVIAPATEDHEAVRDAIAAMDDGGGGTAIGEAVLEAVDEVDRISADGAAAGPSPTPSAGDETERVPARLVLLSDGANTAGRDPSAAAQAAREAGLPVSTIAYGTADGVADLWGGQQSVPVDETTLRQLADDTDGRFYRAESTDELRTVYQDIGSSIGWHVEPVDITPYLALLGLLLAVVAGAFSLRWSSRII